MSIDYQQKYLKYKMKYLDLKSDLENQTGGQVGGGTVDCIIFIEKNLEKIVIKEGNEMINAQNNFINNSQSLNELDGHILFINSSKDEEPTLYDLKSYFSKSLIKNKKTLKEFIIPKQINDEHIKNILDTLNKRNNTTYIAIKCTITFNGGITKIGGVQIIGETSSTFI
jgi:hypothetical protein